MKPLRPSIATHRHAPSALAFMARALLPSPGLPREGGFPELVERWPALRIDPEHLAAYRQATGIDSADEIDVLYPHVLGFRLQMALLTRRAFPLPIWNALQIRNRLVRHRRIPLDTPLDLETRIGGMRRVDKGLELDLHSSLRCEAECLWESVISYFYRGRFGPASPTIQASKAPGLEQAEPWTEFQLPTDGGWRFGSLTGDYNGIHWSDRYARRFGFEAAFLHPQRSAGICLARMGRLDSEAQSLALWIKGPLFYGAPVSLRAGAAAQIRQFGLSLSNDTRMALVGSWAAGPPDP